MVVTHIEPTLGENTLPSPEPSYVIQLYTTVKDATTACELPARIAENLANVPETYHYSTTVGLEDAPDSHQQVFVDQVAQLPEM